MHTRLCCYRKIINGKMEWRGPMQSRFTGTMYPLSTMFICQGSQLTSGRRQTTFYSHVHTYEQFRVASWANPHLWVCGRKQERPEKTPTSMWRTCKLYTGRIQSAKWTFMLWGHDANHRIAVPPSYCSRHFLLTAQPEVLSPLTPQHTTYHYNCFYETITHHTLYPVRTV